MPYIHFTDEQKLRANSVDLVEFLRRQGEKLIPSGRDKRLASDHSITVRGNEWYDHEAEEGGGPISFVQTFYGLSYPEAVTRLLGGEKGEVYQPAQKKEREEPKEFALPPANQTMRRVYAYLLQQRHISREILNAFAQKGLIYESRELSKDKTKEYHTKTAKRRTGLNPFLLFIAAACGTVDKFRLFVFSSQAGLPLPAVRTLLRQFRCVKQIVAVVTRANQINHLDMFSL